MELQRRPLQFSVGGDTESGLEDFLLDLNRLCQVSGNASIAEIRRVGKILEQDINDSLEAQRPPVDSDGKLLSMVGHLPSQVVRLEYGQFLQEVPVPAHLRPPANWTYTHQALARPGAAGGQRAEAEVLRAGALEASARPHAHSALGDCWL
eukprot:Skav220182  [mRNA]  locus=scaffold1271:318977:333880:+ [translate_table: standard]